MSRFTSFSLMLIFVLLLVACAPPPEMIRSDQVPTSDETPLLALCPDGTVRDTYRVDRGYTICEDGGEESGLNPIFWPLFMLVLGVFLGVGLAPLIKDIQRHHFRGRR